MNKRHLSRDERHAHVNSYTQSTLSVKEYATLHAIGYSTFQKWVHDYKTFGESKTESRVSSKVSTNSPCEIKTPQQLAASQPSSSTVHFMDITPRVVSAFVQTDTLKTKVCDETHNLASVPPVSPNLYDKNTQPSSSPLSSSTFLGPIDMFLPNGLRMTFHQTSVATSVELIHALTLPGNHAPFPS